MKPKTLAGALVAAFVVLVAMRRSIATELFEWLPLGRLDETIDADPYVSVIAPHPAEANVLYAGAWRTVEEAALVYRSDDGGASWAAADEGLPAELPPFAGVNDLLLLPGESPAFYAGLGGGGIWRSDDGLTWESAAGGSVKAADTVIALVAAPGPPPTVYALTATGVHRYGSRWKRAANDLPAPGEVVFNDLTLDPTAPATLYAATNPLGLFRSDDGGLTWDEANGDLPGQGPEGDLRNVRGVAVSPHTGEVFVGLRGAGLYRSADGGRTWVASQEGITYHTTLFGAIGAPVFDPHDPAAAYVFNSDGIFRSADSGRTWARIAGGLPTAVTITALAVPAARPGMVYAGTSISGVWELTRVVREEVYVPMVR